MSDQDEDKKILNDDPNQSGSENQSKIEDKNQPEDVQNLNNEKIQSENENINQNTNETNVSDASVEKKDENEGSTHQVIHKKDGRLHIYVRQDKYKGELKSKNWVGRLYIDGKQKISSSGTTNLDEAIPILEKWFDNVQAESEKLKKIAEAAEQTPAPVQNQPETNTNVEEKVIPVQTTAVKDETSDTKTDEQKVVLPKDESVVENNITINNEVAQKVEETIEEKSKSKVSNIFGKLKNLKFKKPSLKGIKLPKSPEKKRNNPFNKALEFFKSKIGKSSVQGEEVIGVELTNKEIRLAQINTNKSNQWVLDKFYSHPIDIPDESSVLENAEKVTTELSLALQKSKIDVNNVAISIPVTSAIIRVVTSPLMKEEELQKAIETNSLWENLVQLTDNLDDYSIFHQVINRNEKDNTMDILFVASKLADINSYVSIVKNSGLNPVIIDVKCFALKSAVDQINQISNKTEDANLTAVLEFGLDENYLMILYDNNPIITDIFLRGQDRKILLNLRM